MLKHILIGVDGSAESRNGARFGLSLAEQTKAKVTLLFVLAPPQVIPVGPMQAFVALTPAKSEQEIQQIRTVLDEIASEKPQLAVERRLEVGNPADVICEIAKKANADLIVLGARGHTTGTRWLVGSVSDRVVHHAPCPVTVWR